MLAPALVSLAVEGTNSSVLARLNIRLLLYIDPVDIAFDRSTTVMRISSILIGIFASFAIAAPIASEDTYKGRSNGGGVC
jgi:hypothetical protein